MSEYIITVDENDERWHYVEQQYTHFFGYPITDEIVRCRDCKHWQPWMKGAEPECWANGEPFSTPPDGYCAWGERRGE